MIVDGVKLMVIGMGTVFVFLTLMVILMSLLSKVLAPFAHIFEQETAAPKRSASKESGKDVIAAIAAAIHMHEKSK